MFIFLTSAIVLERTLNKITLFVLMDKSLILNFGVSATIVSGPQTVTEKP